jgi:transcriptional regulator with XRE-family HTH domain
MEKFSDYITRQYVIWQAQHGKRKTIQEFAAYIGISRPLLNMWMNENRKPGIENIKVLAEIFGLDVYDVLELPRPDPDLQYLQAHWVNLPTEARHRMREEAEKYETKKKK